MPTQIIESLRSIYSGIYPKRVALSNAHQTLLTKMYPTADWQQVNIYEGLPWFMQGSFAIAAVLPAAFRRKRLHIYCKQYLPNHPELLYTLVHEGMHVLQYQELQQKAYGLEFGFCRLFMYHYIGWYLKNWWKYKIREAKSWREAGYAAYRYHPMEIEVYGHEALFVQKYNSSRGAIALDGLPLKYSELQKQHSGYNNYRLPLFWKLMALIICLLISIIRPLATILLLLSLGPIIWIIGKKKSKSS